MLNVICTEYNGIKLAFSDFYGLEVRSEIGNANFSIVKQHLTHLWIGVLFYRRLSDTVLL
jgi:hypothetical protein